MANKNRPAWMDTQVAVDSSMQSIRNLMHKYGADKWSFPELANGDIDIYFEFRGQPVMLSLKAAQMANRLRNLMPRSDNFKIRQQAQRIVARQAFYYLKAVFEVVETGMFSPIDVLLPHFVLPSGEKVSDYILEINPGMKRLLPPGQ